MTPEQAEEVLRFWFDARSSEAGSLRPRNEWFQVDPALDQTIRERFLQRWEEAHAAGRTMQIRDARMALALIVLLDQFPRNMFRGTAQAFASDDLALFWAKTAVARGWDNSLHPLERCFIYLPYEHSEVLEDQEESVRLFSALGSEPYYRETLEYALRHREIIARFGRFPHRNAILGRASTNEESAFLNTPGSSF